MTPRVTPLPCHCGTKDKPQEICCIKHNTHVNPHVGCYLR